MSEKLDTELKEKAAGLGVSVSNLVRNILLNTVEMVEDIVADSNSIARAASKTKPPADEASKTESESSPEVLGWQALTLNLNALCQECNEILPKGSDAVMAVRATPGAPIFRCPTCIPQVQDEASDESDESGDEEQT